MTSTEPLQFKATVPLQPKVELGDYRSIDIRPDPVDGRAEEVDDSIPANLRESHADLGAGRARRQIGDRVGMAA